MNTKYLLGLCMDTTTYYNVQECVFGMGWIHRGEDGKREYMRKCL